MYYKRYDDDTFALFWSPQHLEKFNEHLNTNHINIKLTGKKEVNGSLPLLDVPIEGFVTTVYHKPTSSGVYSMRWRKILFLLI